MNTEQLKTKKTIEEFMTEAGAKAVSEVTKTLLDFHSKHAIKELSDFSSQESKRAVDEFKEKLNVGIKYMRNRTFKQDGMPVGENEDFVRGCDDIIDLIDKL